MPQDWKPVFDDLKRKTIFGLIDMWNYSSCLSAFGTTLINPLLLRHFNIFHTCFSARTQKCQWRTSAHIMITKPELIQFDHFY